MAGSSYQQRIFQLTPALPTEDPIADLTTETPASPRDVGGGLVLTTE